MRGPDGGTRGICPRFHSRFEMSHGEKRSCSPYREVSCFGDKTDILIFRAGGKNLIHSFRITRTTSFAISLSPTSKYRTTSTRINNLMFAFLFSFVNRVDIKVHFSARRKNKSRAKYINRQRRLQICHNIFLPRISSRRHRHREVDEINITLHPPSLEWQSHLSDIVVTSSLGSRRCKTERVTRENTWQRQSDEAELLPSTLERGEHEAEVPSSPRPLSKSDTRYAAKRGDTPEWVRLSAAGRRRRALDGSWRKVRPGKIQ